MEAMRARPSRARMLVPVLLGLAVTTGIYIWAKSVTPDATKGLFGASPADTLRLKSWLATIVLTLALLQLFTALWIYGKVMKRRGKPRFLELVHRGSGAAAILISLPVAYHCLFAYGFRDFDARTVVHSAAGCFLYGAFVAKVAIVRSKQLPGWMLPVAGGTLLTTIVVLWYSTAVWYFNDYDLPILAPAKSAGSSAGGYSSGGGGGGGASGTGAGQVAMRNIQFAPRDITVKAGQTVHWTNDDQVEHDVVAKTGASFRSPGAFGNGGTFSWKAAKPGKVTYVCTIHPGMSGTITVTK
jgi:plastocyanin